MTVQLLYPVMQTPPYPPPSTTSVYTPSPGSYKLPYPSCTLAYAHPNALDAVWQLKFGAPLQSFWATTARRTTNVFLSALSNTLPFVHSWGSFLLGYPPLAVRASAVAAVHRVLAKTPWDVLLSVR